MKPKTNDLIMQNRIFGWIALATAAILMIPLIAMQFSSDVDWRLNDFVIMGILIFGTGSLFVLTARRARSVKRRVIIGAVFLLALLYLWAELAVGIFTHWGS